VNDNPLKIQETMAQQLMRCLFENVTSLRVPWSITPEAAQKDILDRMKKAVDDVTQRVVKQVLSASAVHMEAHLKGIAATDVIKATLVIPSADVALHSLIDRRGGKVMIVLCDMEQYTGGMDSFKATADQLPLIGDEA
jgi:hypothetical protein